MATNGPNSSAIIIDIAIGIAIILIGAVIYIGRLLHKRRRKRKDLKSVRSSIIEMEEMDIESPPKKTAADHLEEIKEATQKVLQPLRTSSTLSLLVSKERKISSSTEGSSITSDRKKFNNIIIPLKSYNKVPPPPPPSPLRPRYDDIEVDPIRMSLLNSLLFENSANSSQLRRVSPPRESRRVSRRASHGESRRASRRASHGESRRASRRASRRSSKALRRAPARLQKDSQTSSQLDSTLPSRVRKISSQKDLRTMAQLDQILPSGTRSQEDSRTSSQLGLTHPSRTQKTSSRKDLRTMSQLDSTLPLGTRSRSSNRKLFTSLHNKETNDYTNFKPVQNIKPIQSAQTAQLKKQITPAEITVKTISKESQDDEVILDATLEVVQ